MSSEEDKIAASNNKTNNDKEIDNSQNERVSLTFVDSIFNNIQNTSKEVKDPLNTKNNIIIYENEKNKNSNPDIETPQKSKQNPTESPKNTDAKSKSSKKSNNRNNNGVKSIKNSNKKVKNLNTVSSAKNIKNPNFNNIVEKKSKKSNKLKNSSVNEKFIAKQESEKEKKLYQQKVKLLENRILALKKQEEEMRRKQHCNEIRQNYINKKKQEKYDFKQKLLSHDIDKRNALEEKRKAIQEQKNQLNNELKESMQKTKTTKMKNYKHMQKEKKIGLTIINENNQNFEKYGKNNVNKIKKEREDFKKNELKKQKNHGKSMDNYYLESCEDNKHETDKLRDKIRKLEELEVEYINNINETRRGIVRNNSVGVYYFNREMTPIKKLDLDEQIDSNHNRKINLKKNNKNTLTKNLLHKSYDDNLDVNINEENENDNEDKLIKVGKKIGVNNKK